MKVKLSAIFLLVFSVAVFFAGWVQFSVPAGKFGVLVSKTGGVDPSPILPGKFRWQWERLLPTNARVVVFDLEPVSVAGSASGTLPSGELYSKMLEGDPDFSWSVAMKVTGRVDPARLPSLVRDAALSSQAGLVEWTKARLESVASDAVNRAMGTLVASKSAATGGIAGADELVRAVGETLAKEAAGTVEILECAPTVAKMPDMSLYALASKTYAEYQSARSELFAKTSAKEADASVAEYLQIERFGRWGELLTKYPILIDFLAVSKDDAGQAFKAVRELRAKQ